MFLEIIPCLFAALAELHLAVAEPGPGARDQFGLGGHIQYVALVADAVGGHHVELRGTERRSNLVLDHLRTNPLTDDLFALLDLPDAADVDAAGTVELQRPAARSRFRTAEHHADLLADLIDEDHRRLALGDHAREFSQRLAHQSGLQSDVRIADLAFKFLLGHQRGYGVDDDDIDGVRFDEHFGNVHR